MDPSKFLTSLDVHPRLLSALAAAADLYNPHVPSLIRLADDLGRDRLGKRLCVWEMIGKVVGTFSHEQNKYIQLGISLARQVG